MDHYKKWGWREFPVKTPFKARVLKFRYRTTGGRENLIAFPSELGVYDGASDEVVALPKVGPLDRGGDALAGSAASFVLRANAGIRAAAGLGRLPVGFVRRARRDRASCRIATSSANCRNNRN